MNAPKRTASSSISGDFQGFHASATRVGNIVEWLDAKGYGWVEHNGKRHFLHIKDFESRPRRPKAGESIRFIEGIDPKGRACAKCVTFVKSGESIAVGVWLLLLALLTLPLMAGLRLPGPWWLVIAGMGTVSAITYGMYFHDKRRATTQGWRVPESSLHLAELLGGWPGALLAQRRLRHKCSKTSYQVVYWTIVLLYQITATDVLLDHRLSRAVLALIKQ